MGGPMGIIVRIFFSYLHTPTSHLSGTLQHCNIIQSLCNVVSYTLVDVLFLYSPTINLVNSSRLQSHSETRFRLSKNK